jgi:O-antigen/teichoic acid export membrane protein
MNTIQTIAKNTAVLFAANIITSILSLILVIYIARYLGAVGFGKYSFALVFTGFFGIITNLGMNELIIREVARDKSKASKYLGNVAIIRAILSIIALVLVVITINLMNYPEDTTTAVYIFALYTILLSVGNIFRVTFRAFEKMEYEAMINILVKGITVSLGLVVLFYGYGLIELAFVFLISSVFNLLFCFSICVKKFARPKLEIDLDFWKEAIKTSIPFSLSSIFIMIYWRIDTVMLSVMKGDAVVGWYNAAYNLVFAFEPIVFIFMSAVFPVMSKLFVSSTDSLKIAYEKSIKYLLIIGLPISVGMMVLADKIILFIYTDAFTSSIIALQILAWGVLLLFLYRPALYLLGSINKQKQMAFIGGMGAIGNIALNLLLIPKFSYVGAGIATIATESLVVVLYFYYSSKYLYKPPIHKIIIKPLIASLVMGIFVYQFKGLNLILVIVFAAVLYFFVLYVIRTFSDEDIDLFKQILKR